MIRFPKDFLWGAATSAYQVEGGNVHSDWWPWEESAGKTRSGSACRHYELYEKDFDLARDLGHNAHRLSVEWGRIEPQEGRFSEEELQHYVDVILALRARGIEPLVTLHHFTNPIWFARSGGWESGASVGRFLRYCDAVVRALSKHVRFWITINEPTIFISHAYIFGAWPPQARSFLKAKSVTDNLVAAHVKAYRLIHRVYRDAGLPTPSVGISQYTQAYVPCVPDLKNRFAASLRNRWFNLGFLNSIARQNAMDFIGANYYTRQLVDLKGWGIANLFADTCQSGHHSVRKNSLGWDIYPEGLRDLLLELKKFGLPVIITENGICTPEDPLRWEYLRSHLKSIHRAMEEGVPVKGYLYWSLLDNFEWDKGFGPRFGLIDVDYGTQQRTVRESARKFSSVCKTGILEAD